MQTKQTMQTLAFNAKLKGEFLSNVESKILNNKFNLDKIHVFIEFVVNSEMNEERTKNNIRNIFQSNVPRDYILMKDENKLEILHNIYTLNILNEDLQILNSYFTSYTLKEEINQLKEEIDRLKNQIQLLSKF